MKARERAFAKTMADRDHAAFADVPGGRGGVLRAREARLRGKAAVAADWKPLLRAAGGAVLLGVRRRSRCSTRARSRSAPGPVKRPDGTSTRHVQLDLAAREGRRQWRVVFDKGCP